MTETNEDLTVQDILDEANGGGEPAAYHAILHLWRDVLRAAETEKTVKVTPQWANRICGSYRGIEYWDMNTFRDTYFEKVLELLNVLEVEIDSDPECLNVTSHEEDKVRNGHHYLNVIRDWQMAFLLWEIEWDCEDSEAAVNMACIAEVHRMFFDQQGLLGLLEQIQFEMTDADRDHIAQSLQELKDAREG